MSQPNQPVTATARLPDGLVLIIEDEPEIVDIVRAYLARDGLRTASAGDGREGLRQHLALKPDLVLLDVQMPEPDGWQVLAELRRRGDTPVIMLTAHDQDLDKLLALRVGADDYVVKPFNPKELVARVRTRLRPTPETSTSTVAIGDLVLDVAGHEVRRGDTRINLTPLEFELLLARAVKPQQVFTREMLLEQVWGYHYKADTRLVNVHVQRLRAKVEEDPDNPRIVMTVRGVGYRAGAVI